MRYVSSMVKPVFIAAMVVAVMASFSLKTEGRESEDLLSYVPAGANVLIGVEMERALDTPAVSNAIADEEGMSDFRKRLERHGIELKHFCRRLLVFFVYHPDGLENSHYGLLFDTAVDESDFRSLLDAESKEADISYEMSRVGDRDVYLVSNDGEKNDTPSPIGGKTAALSYLTPNVVLVIEADQFERAAGEIDAGRTASVSTLPMLADTNRNALLYGVFDLSGAELPASGQEAGPFDASDISGGLFSIDTTGADKRGLDLQIAVESVSEENAQKMNAQVSGFAGMLPLFFENNPQIGMRLSEAIEIIHDKKRINLNMSLDGELIEELQKLYQKDGETK